MIVVDGVPFSANSSSTSTGKDSLLALLENPFLISASNSLKATRESRTSLAHMDSPNIVDMGISQMLSLLIDHSLETELEVHLIGSFEDVSQKRPNGSTISQSRGDLDGYSFPLCAKIIQTLWAREEKFHIKTMCVLGHNTRRDSDGNAYPIFNGFGVSSCSMC
ncbi:hypothetical protein L6164_018026 [Bauhinia variegata]|uniref:Uncharacterized protein n=1 Tax=Bauhinia variegata TaxID=167791 RepID=A0ACB9NA08_BAUVA|nr:hypothetical protein L6164_018026 [Bauhinia variegata]